MVYKLIPVRLFVFKYKYVNPVNDPILDGIDPIHHTPEIININPHKTAESQTSLIYNTLQNDLSQRFAHYCQYHITKFV